MIAAELFSHNFLNEIILKKWNTKNSLQQSYLLSTDTRTFIAGNVFVAIKGEKHDSFHYVEKLLETMPLVVFQHSEENEKLAHEFAIKFPKTIFMSVKDSVLYLQKLACLHVQDWYKKTKIHHLIAISGSNGKTTTKEMLFHLLKGSLAKNVIATEKNNNNHIGVPLTLFNINSSSTQAAVVEFGSNHPGEMKVLCDLAIPNVGITTNIGHTHMEFFENLQQVFEEEGLIYYAVMKQTAKNGVFLINYDDQFLKKFPAEKNTKTFSFKSKEADFFFCMNSLHSVEITNKQGLKIELKNQYITGEHNFSNLATSYVLSTLLFPNYSSNFLKSAESFKPTPNRSEWMKYQNHDVFLDAYNANPSSMRAALQSFIHYCEMNQIKKDECLVVVGEMKELGPSSAVYHEEFGQFVNSLKMPQVIYVGSYGNEFKNACPNALIFANVDLAKVTFVDLLKNSKKCFIKASRSLQLERLVDITKG